MKNRFFYMLRKFLRFLKRQFRNPRKRLAIELLAVVLIIGIVIFIALSGRNIPTDDLDEGISYITALESQDTSETEAEIKAIEKEERKAALENGDLDVWQQFTDSAILGDSRAVGFSYHGFVEDSRVMAEGGATIRDIAGYTEQLKLLNPSSIFLCFGLNDVSIGYWDNVQDYITEQDEILGELQAELPDAVIYVNSIIPAIDPAFERSEKWRKIPDWNQEIKAHCEENNIPYVDITDTVNEYEDLYDPDGIHMKKEFYQYWAIDMIAEVSEYE